MEIPIGFGVEGDPPSEWVIILERNLFVLKDSGLAWFEKIKESLEARGFISIISGPMCMV